MARTVLLSNGTEINVRVPAVTMAKYGIQAVADAAMRTRAFRAAVESDDATIRGIYVRGNLVTNF